MPEYAALPAVAPAKYRRAFIVTYGRSGSTLLQGVLNALPGYLIRGENYDAMRHLELLFNRLPRFGVQRAADSTEDNGVSEPKDPFFGFEAFNDAEIARAIAALVDTLLLRDADAAAIRCLGFKEIRFSPENLAKKVAFLRRIFPGCAVLYNTRNPGDVVQSEFQKDKEIHYFEHFNALMEECGKADPHAFLVRYEDVARGTGTLERLHTFLGEPFDRARIEAVLAVKHSYHRHAEGQFYSDFPRFVQVTKNLRGLSMLVVDRYEPQPETVRIGGLLVPHGAAPRRFQTLLDEQGRSKKFKATFELPSPAVGKRLNSDAAARARFELSFSRGPSDEYRLFLDSDELAVTVRAERPPAD
jgi:hypothetical protein